MAGELDRNNDMYSWFNQVGVRISSFGLMFTLTIKYLGIRGNLW